MKKRRALFSVYDKTGIVALAKTLAEFDIELVATGGTAAALAEAGLAVLAVSDITGFPEMMDGRVKTLHPKIHGGILARRDLDDHVAAMETHQIAPIDFLIVNFYPFAETLAQGGSATECIEQIDIGAPAMVRAAAKNHDFVTIIVAQEDYQKLADEVKTHGGKTDLRFRKTCAQKAFATTSLYDAQIAQWMFDNHAKESNNASDGAPDGTPFMLSGRLKQKLRYGENPHQQANLYTYFQSSGGVANARLLQGKAVSYNNFADADTAWSLVQAFTQPCAAIIKHANPCGVALCDDITRAYEKALAADSVSAFGGIVAVNRAIGKNLAEKITAIFTECVIAPDIEEAALEIFARKKNLRLLIAEPEQTSAPHLHMISGGFLVQDQDRGITLPAQIKNIGARAPSPQEEKDLWFAWEVCKYVKSNAIVLAAHGATCGIGAGQTSRLDSAKIAIDKKPAEITGAVAASDAFFPFTDGVALLAEAGVGAIIQPGGSIKDEAVADYAKAHGLAMWLTGMRHFRH